MNSSNSSHRRIVVFGVGGAGCNALVQLAASAPGEEVRLVAVNTDVGALTKLSGVQTLQLGSSGEPAGNVERGRASARVTEVALSRLIAGSEQIYLLAGMGGGTGTGASVEIAQIACREGIPVHAFVTMPFDFEGGHCKKQAMTGLAELRRWADVLEIVDNEKAMSRHSSSATWNQVLNAANEELLFRSGLI